MSAKSVLPVLGLALLACASVPAASPAAMGPLRVHSGNPRYFADPSGRLVYLTGSHNWETLQDIAPAGTAPFEYSKYLDLLESWNHNFVRMWLWEHAWSSGPIGGELFFSPMPYERTGPGTARDGKPKFDLRRFNQAYFDRLRQRVTAAGQRGMYVGLVLFVSQSSETVKYHAGWADPGWAGHPYHRDNNINGIDGDADGDETRVAVQTLRLPAVTALQKAFVRKVVDTVGDLDNVLYEISNESRPESVPWQYEMISFIKDYETKRPKQHPVGMTTHGGGPTTNDLLQSGADWISDSHDVAPWSYRTNPPPTDGKKVSFADTDHIWGMAGYDPTWPWKSFFRGYNPVYMDALVRICPLIGNVERNAFHEESRMPIRHSMGYTRAYADRMNLDRMTPQGALSTTDYCLADIGREYLVYQPDTKPFAVSLPAGKYTCDWFNPAVGTTTATEEIEAAGGNRPFTPPFAGQAVLYIKSAADRGRLR